MGQKSDKTAGITASRKKRQAISKSLAETRTKSGRGKMIGTSGSTKNFEGKTVGLKRRK